MNVLRRSMCFKIFTAPAVKITYLLAFTMSFIANTIYSSSNNVLRLGMSNMGLEGIWKVKIGLLLIDVINNSKAILSSCMFYVVSIFFQ